MVDIANCVPDINLKHLKLQLFLEKIKTFLKQQILNWL